MTVPLIKLDRSCSTRCVLTPDWLWEAVRKAAEAESLKTGVTVLASDIVRQGAYLRAQAILGTIDEAA